MSKGAYDAGAHRRAASSRSSMRKEQVFTGKDLDPRMDLRLKPYRECISSPVYTRVRPVIFGPDETGSMHAIPQFLATDPRGLPGMVKAIYPFMEGPQICFIGVGDSRCYGGGERAPLQVGEFEGEGHLMDQWLQSIALIGGGGGNGGESYELPLFVAARLVRSDCWERGDMGYLFLTGDDSPFPQIRAHDVQRLIGIRIEQDIPLEEIIAEVKTKWHPFFLIPDPARARYCENDWRRYLGDSVIVLESHHDTALVTAGLIGLTEKTLTDLDLFDQMMLEEFDTKDRTQRSRIIHTLEAYAATQNLAGQQRSVDPEAASEERESGNARA